MNIDELEALATGNGLVLRGVIQPIPDDQVPPLPTGEPAGALVLFGQAGSTLWPVFSRSVEYQDQKPDPLDRWSRRIGEQFAARTAGQALFPFGGPPFHPFVRWATRAEGLKPSRIGMLLHPKFGLWHAYRFALTLAEPVTGQPAPAGNAHACDYCEEQPCLSACPVGAFDGQQYDVKACYHYLRDHADARCHRDGCQARVACPEGAAHHYAAEQVRFHMKEFYQALHRRQRAVDST